MGKYFQKNEMNIIYNQDFLKKAEKLKPVLFHAVKYPLEAADMKFDNAGETRIYDFGEHLVGYLSFHVSTQGSPQDAPVKLRLTFGEMPCELTDKIEEYEGWISRSWFQEEILFIDTAPEAVTLKRRYSFRYLKIEVLAISEKYSVVIGRLQCDSVTSADIKRVAAIAIPEDFPAETLLSIDNTAVHTLRECMQEVFEDGPKRDRRLWLGDLRLQALTNYQTFQNYDLVKRCLYLFAGAVNEDERISACLFINPKVIPDDSFLFDYSLLYIPTLYEYYEVTKDRKTLDDLSEIALKQIWAAARRLDNRSCLIDEESWWSFIDWNDDLNKQAASQGVFLYCLGSAVKIAEVIGSSRIPELKALAERVKQGAETLWDERKQFFVSGKELQVSYASQIWMILGGVPSEEQAQRLMDRLLAREIDGDAINSPYLYHYFLEALMALGRQEAAIEVITGFWGQMIREGADTFWEIYNPENPEFSPYGGLLMHSYCHAWSCTPAYFIRKIFSHIN